MRFFVKIKQIFEMESLRWFWCVVIFFAFCKFSNAAPTGTQKKCANNFIVVENITKSDFEAGPINEMKKVIAQLLDEYCSKNAYNCSLQTWNTTRDSFNNNDIAMHDGYPKEIEKNLEVSLKATLRANSSIEVPSVTLRTIIENNLSNISHGVGRTVKMGVCTVTEKSEEAAPVDHTMDYIMIPIGFFILLLLCFLACILHRNQKQVEKEREKRRKQEYVLQQKKKEEARTKNAATQAVVQHKAKSKIIDDNNDKEIRHSARPKPPRRKKQISSDSENEHEKQHTRKIVVDVSPTEDSGDPPSRRHRKRHSSRKHRSETNAGYVDDENNDRVDGDVKARSDNTAESDAVDEARSHRKKKKRSKRRHHRGHGETDEGYHEESNGHKHGPEPPVVVVHQPSPRTLPPLTPTSPQVHDTKM